jgi:predicted RND superfamily exporter protein
LLLTFAIGLTMLSILVVLPALLDSVERRHGSRARES